MYKTPYYLKLGDFFIYGGLAIHSEKALGLSKEIGVIRSKRKVPPDFQLKFNPSPNCLDHDAFKLMKQGLIEAAVRYECNLLVSVILHDIATAPEDARLNEINRIVFHFDSWLAKLGDSGIVLIDRFSDSRVDSHLREKFSIGLTGMPYSGMMKLKNIVGFHYSAIGQSHFPSLTDIVLGSLRYATNEFTRADPAARPKESALLRLVSPLFVRTNKKMVPDLGMNFSPKIIKKKPFLDLYREYQAYLRTNGIESVQEIADHRMY